MLDQPVPNLVTISVCGLLVVHQIYYLQNSKTNNKKKYDRHPTDTEMTRDTERIETKYSQYGGRQRTPVIKRSPLAAFIHSMCSLLREADDGRVSGG
jgi:hypothetical protein